MKILHVTTHLNTGGITTYLLTLVKEQVKAGHQVYVWASGGVCLEAFEACCVKVVSDVPRCKSELSPMLWMQLPKLISFLKKYPMDMIHTHTRVAQVLTAVATHAVKIPCVSTAHMFYKNRLGRRFFSCWGQAVMAISQTMRKGLIDIFGERNLPPITVTVNGIDVEALRSRVCRVNREEVRRGYGYQPEHFIVLALSRLVPVKGIHILIEAFAVARQQVPEMRLLISGGGDEVYIQKLKQQVSRLGLQPVVSFLGNTPEIEKPFKAADVFAAPYLWPEAFGLSILEAMTVGLPVIGSNSGGIAELLGYGSCGLLFEEGHVEKLARCLLDYYADPGLRQRMSKAARETASNYSSLNMSTQIQKVYERVLGSKA